MIQMTRVWIEVNINLKASIDKQKIHGYFCAKIMTLQYFWLFLLPLIFFIGIFYLKHEIFQNKWTISSSLSSLQKSIISKASKSFKATKVGDDESYSFRTNCLKE
jgi:hypothetical protein